MVKGKNLTRTERAILDFKLPRVVPLPDKMSDLLEVAVTDAQEAQKIPGMGLDMSNWVHEGMNKCRVCLGGAVMLRRKHRTYVSALKDESDQTKIRALDYMRTGNFFTASYDMLGEDLPDELGRELEDIVLKRFNNNTGRTRWEYYTRCVKLLRENGY